MKKYIIRSIGWIFDDDWYNFDGDHDVVGIYDSKEEAENKVDELNHIYFLDQRFLTRSLQISYIQNEANYSLVHENKIASMISKFINVDLDHIYQNGRGFYLER